MERKKISLEEKREIQLKMLSEFDEFCKVNNIRYSLAFGTLLGAIRHKGFIPWDDDVDLMIPVSDMQKLKKSFHSETMHYMDFEIDSDYNYIFSRIYNNQTYELEGGSIKSNFGINIDLYPFIDIPDNDELAEKFFDKAIKLSKIRYFFIRWNARFVKYLHIKRIPYKRQSIKNVYDYFMKHATYGRTGRNFVIASDLAMRDKDTYNQDLFANMITVDFENLRLQSIKNYDYFLRHEYGDYMQLPPVEKRVPYHGGDYYWK